MILAIKSIPISYTTVQGEQRFFILEAPNAADPFQFSVSRMNIRGKYRDRNNMLRRKYDLYTVRWQYSYESHDMDLRELLTAESIQIATPPDFAGDYTGYDVMFLNREAVKNYLAGLPVGRGVTDTVPSGAATLEFEIRKPLTFEQVLDLKWFESIVESDPGPDPDPDPEFEEVIEVFTESGTWDWEAAGEPETVDVLVVAGGGGGGSRQGGGGGGGGLIWQESFEVNTNVTVTIGNGGSGGTSGNKGSNGGNSLFGTLESIGGGGGGGRSDASHGSSGGSGGGGSGTKLGGSGTVDQGNDGGDGNPSLVNSGGGGGGAGEVGGNALTSGDTATNLAGDGGNGLDFSATFGTEVGENGWFSGGGGGGCVSSEENAHGVGGIGGGGDGENFNAKGTLSSGQSNTGGGGGGSSESVDPGGGGGSGIVIVLYLKEVESV